MLAILMMLFLQTPATKSIKTTKGAAPHAAHTKSEERSIESQTTTTTTTETHTTATHRTSTSSRHASDYAARLASLLADTQGKASLGPASWKAVANEGNALANKLYASTSGKNRTAAKEARTHVRLMHAAAMKGDADGAKSHAAMALPYVYEILGR